MLKFMIDGLRIHGSNTPEELELEDNDRIDVFFEVVGGAG